MMVLHPPPLLGRPDIQVYCRDCPRFDLEAERCKDGKVNPLDWETAVSVSRQFGVRALCMFNDHRERLIHVRTEGVARAPRP
ncbi:MAG: hypothetical protein M9921_15180 [Fimbriimonadaceae bacterium]|nr:hypothetical protein [Chthonomonadaceae bacterium]MCO5298190.1 hypothetical protein [Fimbriimonadaceae bacterium]